MHVRSYVITLAVVVAAAVPAAAQDGRPGGSPSAQGFSQLPFNFAPPGARSLAMGATFIGIADDATAAASNPAGLVILTKPEISAHVRVSQFEDTFEEGFQRDRFGSREAISSTVTSPSFFSVVVPVQNASFSVSYQQIANFNQERGTFQAETSTVFGQFNFTAIDVKVEDFSVAGGFKLGDKVSVGVAVGQRKLTFRDYSNFEELFTEDFGPLLTVAEFGAFAEDSDDQVYWSAGVLVNPNGRVSVGAVYKKGGEFTLPYTSEAALPIFGIDTITTDVDENDQPLTGTLQIPDSFGFGVGFRPTPNWLLSADVAFVKFSQLGETDFRISAFDLFPPRTLDQPPSDYDDVVQLHAGVEYTFTTRTPFSLRAGVFNDPDHDQAEGVDTSNTFVTAGAGVVLGQRFQIDVAGAFSDQVKEGLASLVIRF
jgi:long-subunit fatty acid transport protein